MSAKYLYTVYQTTNNVNGKIYIGVHKTLDPNDDYLGSGTVLNNAIKKYGKENFTKKILYTYKYKKCAYNKENELVNEEFINRNDTYNIALGGKGGDVNPTKRRKNLPKNKVLDIFKDIHGNKYDYSLVEYLGMHEKIEIVCPIHGSFFQKAYKHKNGRGCSKCGHVKKSKSKTLSKEDVIRQFKNVHKNNYEYSLVEYINSKTKVKIFCNIHGIFEQTPKEHKKGQGCPKCGILKSIKTRKKKDLMINPFFSFCCVFT